MYDYSYICMPFFCLNFVTNKVITHQKKKKGNLINFVQDISVAKQGFAQRN